jgi:hypothetical protein
MNYKKVFSPLGLIDSDNLDSDEKHLFSIYYEMFPDKEINVFKKGKYLVIHTKYWSKIKKIWRYDQEEFPLISLPWIVDSVENGFFKPQDRGGVSDFERSLRKEFEGEMIGVNAMAHCCAENLPGFNIWNANRKSYISDIPPHEWDIPSYMLIEQRLLEKLKSLAHDFEQGRL